MGNVQFVASKNPRLKGRGACKFIITQDVRQRANQCREITFWKGNTCQTINYTLRCASSC
jgi:hypothetical protein